MKRDVTAGVHSAAILGYFTIAVYGDKGHDLKSMTSRNILNIRV